MTEIQTRFKLIHEHECTGDNVTDICSKYGISRKTYYTSGRIGTHIVQGIDGLNDRSSRPRNIRERKLTPDIEQIILLALRLNSSRFGTAARIKFRLKRRGVTLSSKRTVYKVLKRHGVNRLSCKIKRRKYMRFNKKHPNAMVQQMDILGPFYLRNSSTKNYIISCIDDCTRKKVASRWTQRKRSTDVLDVLLQDWIRTNGKPEKVMHDNGRRQLTSKTFRRYLIKNDIKDRPIPAAYPHSCRERSKPITRL